MNSPYFQGGGGAGGWGPPGGLAQIYEQRRQALKEAGQTIGGLAGGLAAGGIGAFQGAANPGLLGKETKSGGAFQGFLQNFQADQQRQPGGGFSGLLGGGRRGGGGMGADGAPNPDGMNVKQLMELDKASTSFRNAMKSSIPTTEGQDLRIFGMTDDEWKTAGARDRWGSIQNFLRERQDQQSQQAFEMGMKTAAARLQAQQMEMEQAGAQQATMGRLQEFINTPQPPVMANRGLNPNTLAQFAQQNPEVASIPAFRNLTQFAQDMQPKPPSGWNLAPGATMPGPNGTTLTATSPNSVQVVQPETTKATKELSQVYPWLMAEDDTQYLQGLRTINDPAELQNVIKARQEFNRTMGKHDPINEAIASILVGSLGGKLPSAPAAAPKARKYNPETKRIE